MGRMEIGSRVVSGPWRESGPDASRDGSGESVFELSGPEQLLLWSARRWRHGRHGWSEVEAEFRRQLTTRWADALVAWEGVLDIAHRRTAGVPTIENGCVTRISRDERRLLSLVAAAQRGGSVAPDLLLAGVAGRADRLELRRLIDELGEALGHRRLPLGHPRPVASPSPPPPAKRYHL